MLLYICIDIDITQSHLRNPKADLKNVHITYCIDGFKALNMLDWFLECRRNEDLHLFLRCGT